jgi:multimeric flavodoxin WrbA
MKVLLVNSSPHPKGCTYTALAEVAKGLAESSVESEIFQLGTGPVEGCRACGWCKKNDGCIITDDGVNALLEKAEEFDGFVFGSPVHYAAASGVLTATLDRAFMAGGSKFAFKPGAAVVSCRRAGSSAALDQINKYFTINNMPVVSSQYWNMVHGANAGQVAEDVEGLQTMRVLGRNMAWLLKSIEAGKAAGVEPNPYPNGEKRAWTNFISG